MSTIKANKHQVGSNVVQNLNVVLEADAINGDLIISKGAHDGVLTEIQRIRNDGSGVTYTPAGTGAVDTTVQDRLCKEPVASDYSTNAQYVDAIQALATNQHFTQHGAIIKRIPDRLFVGDAVDNDGAYPNTEQDWLTQYQVAAGLSSGSVVSSSAAILTNESNASAAGLVVGAHAQHFTASGPSLMGTTSITVQDNPTYTANQWAFYGEAHRDLDCEGSVYGLELDLRIKNDSIAPTPYQQGDVVGIQLAVGAELSATGQYDGSCAIQLASNPKQWKVGINILDVSLPTNATAIALSPTKAIRWFNSAGNQVGGVNCTNTSANRMAEVRFDATGVGIVNNVGSSMFHIFSNDNATYVNYMNVAPNSSGAPPYLAANGSDTDIDIQFSPNGNGKLLFGTWTSNADAAINGYITIKDSSSTLRKLATIA